jgi:hypothetical protein
MPHVRLLEFLSIGIILELYESENEIENPYPVKAKPIASPDSEH